MTTMSKIITIKSCSECQYTNEHEDFCTEAEKVIYNPYIIPDWCPLPDNKPSQRMQWVSVDDRLPEDGQIVDVWIVSNGLFNQRLTDVVYSSTSLTFQIDDICDVGIEPHPTNSFITHWMPLPKSPMGECSDEDLY